MKPHRASTDHWCSVFGVAIPAIGIRETEHTTVRVSGPCREWLDALAEEKRLYWYRLDKMTAWEFLRRVEASRRVEHRDRKGLAE